MYRRLWLDSATLSGCRKIHMSTSFLRAADTTKSPIEHTPDNKEYPNAGRTHDFIDITNTQRMILSVGSSLAALVNPRR